MPIGIKTVSTLLRSWTIALPLPRGTRLYFASDWGKKPQKGGIGVQVGAIAPAQAHSSPRQKLSFPPSLPNTSLRLACCSMIGPGRKCLVSSRLAKIGSFFAYPRWVSGLDRVCCLRFLWLSQTISSASSHWHEVCGVA